MAIFSTALIVVKDGHYIYLPGGGGEGGGATSPKKLTAQEKLKNDCETRHKTNLCRPGCYLE